MSIHIDPREVLEHLEYLGYTSITKDQLKEFIRDLKRLIKYEQSKQRNPSNFEQASDKVSVGCETSLPYVLTRTQPEDGQIIRQDSDRATYNLPQDNVEQSHGFDDTSCQSCGDKSSSNRSYHPNDYIDDGLKNKECHDCSCCCCKKLGHNNPSKENPKKNTESEKPPQPIPSFIRPGTGKPSKCDPVTLYHYYQNQWSKRPLPGEDPRTDLRWAIRSRLAQQPQQRSGSLQQRKNDQQRLASRPEFVL